MFGILIQKELKAILLSPKFAVTFGICAFLLLLSVFIGISEYNASVKQYDTGKHARRPAIARTKLIPDDPDQGVPPARSDADICLGLDLRPWPLGRH